METLGTFFDAPNPNGAYVGIATNDAMISQRNGTLAGIADLGSRAWWTLSRKTGRDDHICHRVSVPDKD